MAVGSAISKERIGERVLIEPCIRELKGKELAHPGYFGSECDGGFAEYTTVASRHAYKVNSRYSDAELASFPCSYSTAENMHTRAAVKANETVVVTGASGGVGSAAVQLAKARGAKVIAIAELDKEESLLEMGADQVIDRFSADLAETLGVNSIDAVIDMIAGKQFPEYIRMLKIHGRYAVCSAIAGPHVDLDIRDLYLKDLSLFGCTVLQPEVFGNLVRHINEGSVSPVVAMEYPLENIREAQDVFVERKHLGKMVLKV